MDLHYLRDTRQRYLDEQATCHEKIRETNDPLVVEEAAERLDKAQLALDSNAPVFALLDGLDELHARLDRLETVVAGDDRTFHEIIEDNALFAKRVNSLEKQLDIALRRLGNASNRITASEQEHDELGKRLARLEVIEEKNTYPPDDMKYRFD